MAPWFAREIMMKAEACGRTHMITDASAVYLTTGLSKEERDKFRVDLEKLIVIQYKDRSDIGPRNSGARLLAGKLWFRIQKLVGGHVGERDDTLSTNAVIGVRG
jgi:hypothetical protein